MEVLLGVYWFVVDICDDLIANYYRVRTSLPLKSNLLKQKLHHF